MVIKTMLLNLVNKESVMHVTFCLMNRPQKKTRQVSCKLRKIRFFTRLHMVRILRITDLHFLNRKTQWFWQHCLALWTLSCYTLQDSLRIRDKNSTTFRACCIDRKRETRIMFHPYIYVWLYICAWVRVSFSYRQNATAITKHQICDKRIRSQLSALHVHLNLLWDKFFGQRKPVCCQWSAPVTKRHGSETIGSFQVIVQNGVLNYHFVGRLSLQSTRVFNHLSYYWKQYARV